MTHYTFEIGRHNEQAHEYTSALINEAYNASTTAQERVSKAEILTEAFYAQVGQTPAESVLSRLAWYIVFDEMTDTHPDKITREEYPMLSRGQLKRRDEKTTLLDDLPYGDTRELGKRKVCSNMLTDDGEDKDDYRPFVDSIRLIGQRRSEADGLIDELTFDGMLDCANLTERERYSTEEMFRHNRTQCEIASDLGVSQARVSQLLNSALDKIRRKLTE